MPPARSSLDSSQRSVQACDLSSSRKCSLNLASALLRSQGIVSAWTWAATLLQSSAVAYKVRFRD